MKKGFLVLCLFISSLFAEDQKMLKMTDVKAVMEDIFSQHVSQKKMTPKIIRQSLQEYINDFDPDRIYLLDEEVSPFLHLSDADIEKVLKEYQENQYPIYQKLNLLFIQAIVRARKIREELEKNPITLFHEALAPPQNEEMDPNAYQPFPKTLDELKSRIQKDMVKYIQYGQSQVGLQAVLQNKAKVLNLYENSLKTSENNYLSLEKNNSESVNQFALNILKAFAGSLDAHTKVFNNREAEEMKSRLEKEVFSVGITLKKEGNKVLISSIDDNSSAKKNGLQKNDELLQINDKPIEKKSIDELMELLNNGKNSSVSLTVKRDDHPLNFKLTRDVKTVEEGRVEVSSEPFEDGIIGKIVLHSFYQNDEGISSEKDMRKAIKDLKSKGTLKGLILDLRDNMGGFLNQAVKVTGLFIKAGIVVISKYSNGEERIFRDVDGKKVYSGPLIILTSKETASAAEIVAESLSDYGVALIVGDKETYGKGTIQSQNVTNESTSSFFKVTVGKYYTISGNTPQMHGVKVDLVVPSSISQERIGERYLENSIPADTIPPKYQDNLNDVSFTLKPWYIKNYLPKMQVKEEKWKKLVPLLKQKSERRISKNGVLSERLEGAVDVSDEEPGEFRSNDYQMEEAVSIMKDMIQLEEEKSKNLQTIH